ncbi:DNA-binding protein inhibitor ID-2-like [Patiria miniata]|uniref:BHLH domain-containing protein n=1 Tax=Patiria miniata TaxID=46514 RepID=A0A913ZYH2_PATMI|nr:DNA-binding protein inhibitor ID-2-like [Patiria miniata]
MKNTLAGQNLAQSSHSLASQSHLAMHRTRPTEESIMSHHHAAGGSGVHPKKATTSSSKSRAFNYTMHDCYERLKELVPTIPKNKKITRVEILQHVIDYIQDLQSALESHNINVRRSAMPGMPGGQNSRTPFTSLTPQQNLDMLSGLADLENCDWQRTLLNLTSSTRGTKLHPYETPDSSPEALSTCSC